MEFDNVVVNCRSKIIETNKVFEPLRKEELELYGQQLRRLDEQNGIHLSDDCLNSYDNSDYVIVANILQSVKELHRTTYFNPYTGQWIKGNSEMPYIHFRFYQRAAMTDKGLNMGVSKPNEYGAHILNFNYYWLQQYIGFLQQFFDNNEEYILELPPDMPDLKVEYSDREELLGMVSSLRSQGLLKQANVLEIYAKRIGNDKFPKPILTVIKDNLTTWGFYDDARNVISVPLKKPIYLTSGFADLFHDRNAFVSEVFFCSLKFILGHETAHVARGHWNLRINEKDYSSQRNVMMNCEINADWTSAHWMLNEFLYHTVDGRPETPILSYTSQGLAYCMAVRIFSCYLALSWVYRDDREWDESNLDSFIKNKSADHPIYNFRVYNILGKIKQHIDEDFIKKEDAKQIRTIDGVTLGEVSKAAYNQAMDMILSFESAFKKTWGEDNRDTLQKLRDELNIEYISKPKKVEQIPFMMAFLKKAQNEFADYETIWPEVLEKLRKYGMYFVM